MNPLKFGWIDYSSEHRDKVMTVLHALSSEGAVDELGIGRIRDGFSDILFPGTSTIQTRAKYFFIIPYLLMELEKERFDSPNRLINRLSEAELDLIDALNKEDADGVIGAVAGRSLKRKPSAIYWSGLRTFGFLKQPLSLKSYAKAVYSLKNNQKSSKDFGNEIESDFNDIDGEYISSFWRCPLPEKNWKEQITIELSFEEAGFLKERIIKAADSKDSLFAYLLQHDPDTIEKLETFDSIGALSLPDAIKNDYMRAQNFNKFISGANIRYNLILSQGQNEVAIQHWDDWLRSDFVQYEFASFDYKEIMNRLNINNLRLFAFLRNWQEVMLSRDESMIDKLIINREIDLKGKERAKLYNTKVYNYDDDHWLGSRNLQYRFPDAKIIMKDIFTGLEKNHVTAV